MDTGVYCFKNIVDGKMYVGSASKSIWARRKSHLKMLRANRHHSIHFQHAWNKYGRASFRFSVLYRCEPKDCLTWEQFYIDVFQVADCRYGYNRNPNASSCLGKKLSPESVARMRSRRPSEETKRKIREALKGRVLSQESIAKGAAKRKGMKYHTEESKKKISAAQKGRVQSQEEREKRAQSLKGRKISPDAILKTAAWHQGRKRSEEAKRKMSEARKQWWQKTRTDNLFPELS